MDYMRKDFMSNVSHEVKTPVAAITGFVEILFGWESLGRRSEGVFEARISRVHSNIESK